MSIQHAMLLKRADLYGVTLPPEQEAECAKLDECAAKIVRELDPLMPEYERAKAAYDAIRAKMKPIEERIDVASTTAIDKRKGYLTVHMNATLEVRRVKELARLEARMAQLRGGKAVNG